MDAKKKLILIMLVTSIMGLLFQTPIMLAVGGGMHTFINGRNIDCISCHGYGSANSHQAGSDTHQEVARNKNYTTYLEVGGTSYDPAGIIYTNIDSDSSGTNDVWIWNGDAWVYDNKAKLYDLDFNGDGNIGGTEICKLCHNRELMRTSAQLGPEHSFGERYCNDARCHGNSNEDFRFFKNGYNTIPPASISNPGITTGNFYINNTWTNPYDPDFNYTLFKESNGTNLTTVNFSINYFNRTLSPHYAQNISAQTVDIYDNINQTKVWFNATIPNNPPILSLIGSINTIRNINIVAGSILQFNITAIDADNDTLTYGTNATKGSLNTTTGEFLWETTTNDSGEYVWDFNATDNYGGIVTETIMITVSNNELFIPPIPANLTVMQGNFWINYTWEPGTGTITDSYNLSVNGNWTNGTTLTYHNDTVGPHGWSNITIWAYNNTGGMNSISRETQVLNNQPVLDPIGNKNVTAGSNLRFNVTAIDADNDILSYGTNASKGILNKSTGEYSWNTGVLDIGTYIWYFNSSDNYSGLASEIITVTVTPESVYDYFPPVPANLSSTQGNFWINHTWEPGTGNETDSYNVTLNGIWINGTIETFYNTSVLPHGWNNITVFAYNISGNGSLSSSSVSLNTRLANNLPIQTPIGDRNITAGNVLNFNFSANDIDSDPITYGTNASNGLLNNSTGLYSWSTNSSDVGTYTWYFNSSDSYGGIASETITVTVSALPGSNYMPDAPVNLTVARGNFWIEYTWEPGTGNLTDSYNLTVNGTSYTTTTPSRNDTVGPHGWSNISVMSYNNSGTGSLNTSSIFLNTQVLNNIPVQSPLSGRTITAGDVLSFTVHAEDADSDSITYATNASNGLLNNSTGLYSWSTNSSDVGTHTWYFNSSDNYGGVDKETITVTVTPQAAIEYIPPVPVNLISTQGNFWVNYTWQAGSGNVTDSYNVSHNGLWSNSSSLTNLNNYIGSHGWSNISVYAYNNSGRLSLTPASMDTPVANSVPVQDPIGSQSVIIGNQLIITVHATDADFDIITYSTNATKGSINSSTGVYTWTPGTTDAGTYEWSFNSSDNYGGVDKETITVTVTSQPVIGYIPPVPVNLISTQGNFWVNYTWQAGSGNVTDSYNVSHNGLWSNGSSLTNLNNYIGSHGWSNISVYAYNNSGRLSLTPASMDTPVANSVPVQDPIGSQSVIIGNQLIITVHATDADFDIITYSTNATKGSINSSTGVYTWTPGTTDAGTYEWSFNSSDNYGGVDKETITVTVTSQPVIGYIPPVPVNLISTQGNFWVNYTWQAGSGNVTDSYNVSHNGLWSNGSSLTNLNNYIGSHGWSNISVYAYNNSGRLSLTPASMDTPVANSVPVQDPIGSQSVIIGNQLIITVHATDADFDIITYSTNATKGSINSSTGVYTWTPGTTDAGTYQWSFNSRDNYGGVDKETIVVTVDSAPLPAPPVPSAPPAPISLGSTQGNFWIEYTWQPGIGTKTDSYNLNVNGIPSSTSLTTRRDDVVPHGWSNITVWAYNNSGGQSLDSVSRSTQVQNNQPSQSLIGNKNVVEGDTVQFTVSSTDADGDTLTFDTDATKGNLNSGTGAYSWKTSSGDAGQYTWYFKTMDSYGGVDIETIVVTVNPAPLPPTPVNLDVTQGNFWIEYTWQPGIGTITDSYNLIVNGVPSSTSLTSRKDEVGPHGWSEITVWAYNNSGGQSRNSVSLSTQVKNNDPVLNIGDKNVVEGSLLQFQLTASDADSDTLTFSTDASNGSLDPGTGAYSWQTKVGDAGIYTWNFNAMDNYGGVDTRTITVTVSAAGLT